MGGENGGDEGDKDKGAGVEGKGGERDREEGGGSGEVGIMEMGVSVGLVDLIKVRADGGMRKNWLRELKRRGRINLFG